MCIQEKMLVKINCINKLYLTFIQDFMYLQIKRITKLQAIWRGKMVRKDFYHLFHTANPPYKIVKHFACLLNFNLEDYHRELELQVGFKCLLFI